MVAVGRNQLIHEDWAKRAIKGEEISECKSCKKCYFFGAMKKCPALEKGKKEGLIK
jgi:2,4-dienoyl-CoA reductase-like NADH-dependent reductase (Old Yellow Enzyme family)